jgi:P-type E1-E2 ATPase
MVELEIPGRGTLQIEHLVCDVNGTLAVDGELLPRVAEAIERLRSKLTIHLVTANTHGQQHLIDKQLCLQATILEPGGEPEQKAAFVRELGAEHCAALGQGANDAAMLKTAAIGICIMSPEGSATATLMAADLVTPDILTALTLLDKPRRITASLRQ